MGGYRGVPPTRMLLEDGNNVLREKRKRQEGDVTMFSHTAKTRSDASRENEEGERSEGVLQDEGGS